MLEIYHKLQDSLQDFHWVRLWLSLSPTLHSKCGDGSGFARPGFHHLKRRVHASAVEQPKGAPSLYKDLWLAKVSCKNRAKMSSKVQLSHTVMNALFHSIILMDQQCESTYTTHINIKSMDPYLKRDFAITSQPHIHLCAELPLNTSRQAQTADASLIKNTLWDFPQSGPNNETVHLRNAGTCKFNNIWPSATHFPDIPAGSTCRLRVRDLLCAL